MSDPEPQKPKSGKSGGRVCDIAIFPDSLCNFRLWGCGMAREIRLEVEGGFYRLVV